MTKIFGLLCLTSALFCSTSFADGNIPSHSTNDQLSGGRQAIHKAAGCYAVDYSFVETDVIKPGYVRDSRVYDVNNNKTIKEWIYVEDISQTRIRVQHILFGVDLQGNLIEDAMLKHTGEEWEFNAPYLFDFTGTNHWAIKDLSTTPNLWTRKITNLDDGLRYQCAAAWNLTTRYPEWSCGNTYAPIPGREYRDLGRKDYNTLLRSSKLVRYDGSWIEREANTKINDVGGVRDALVKEQGKTWYVRLPDADCAVAREFVRPRHPFWTIVRQAWDQVYAVKANFVEKQLPGESRYNDISTLEEQYLTRNLNDPQIQKAAKTDVLNVIQKYHDQ